MFTQFTACVSHDICAKLARNLGAWSTHFRKEIWGAWLRNSRSPQAAGAGHGAGLEGLARLQDSGADRHVRGVVTRVLVKHFVL